MGSEMDISKLKKQFKAQGALAISQYVREAIEEQLPEEETLQSSSDEQLDEAIQKLKDKVRN